MPIGYAYLPIFANISNHMWSMITQWAKLIGLLLVSF
jgi:hypothetical protein